MAGMQLEGAPMAVDGVKDTNPPKGATQCARCGERFSQGTFVALEITLTGDDKPPRATVVMCLPCELARRGELKREEARIAEAMTPAAIRRRMAKVPVTRAAARK
jgi:hypothetical protein